MHALTSLVSAGTSGIPMFVVPGAEWPGWAPWAFGAAGLVGLAVLIYQAVRYFRNNRDD